MRTYALACALLLAAGIVALAQESPKVTIPKGANSYETLRPYFKENCFSCHGDGRNRGGFSLETYESMMAGGEDGQMIKRGDGEGSPFVKYLRGKLQPQMPRKRPPLPDADIKAISDWIQQGAKEKLPK